MGCGVWSVGCVVRGAWYVVRDVRMGTGVGVGVGIRIRIGLEGGGGGGMGYGYVRVVVARGKIDSTREIQVPFGSDASRLT